jgi:hypothetical protein
VTEDSSKQTSFPLLSGRDFIVKTTSSEEVVEEVKQQWKRLWRERIDDKMKAEGIANDDFSMLFIEKGTIIFATRNFKMVNLKEILELHKLTNADRIIQPNPQVGGWGKFIRTNIASQKPSNRVRQAQNYFDDKKERQQSKKGGRGWLHL